MNPDTSSKPLVDAATVAALRELWATDTDVSAIRWAYRKAAAVLASFEPDRIRPADGEAPLPGGYPDLESDAEATSGDKDSPWQLLPEVRKDALAMAESRAQMREALAANPERPTTPLQRMLDAVLEGALPGLADLPAEDLRALLVVRRWLENILAPAELPNADDVAAAFAKADLMSPFHHLLKRGFVGRRSQLHRLRSFLWDEGVTAPLRLYGIGGVGKSTLLAKLIVDEVRRAGERLLIVPLDVDRPSIDPRRPHTFFIEAIQQILRQRPSLVSEGNWAINSIRELGSRISGLQEERALESARYSDKETYWVRESLVRDLGAFLNRAIQAPDGRALFVIDTFEEVQLRGAGAVDTVLALFGDLMSRSSGVRVVFSGRIEATEGSRANPLPVHKGPRILLKGLDHRSADSLLRRQLTESGLRLDSQEISDVIDVVGTNPLCINLAARFIDLEGVHALLSPEMRDEFLSRLEADKIQGFLFGRILDHMRSEEVKPLAYPGLIVRRVTPEIILEVLAQPCGLRLGGIADARNLYAELAQEGTLVEPEGPDALRYRPDLRRELLPDVLKRVSQEVAREIDRRAVTFYGRSEGNPALAEEIYHRLRLGDTGSELEARWTHGVGAYLKGSVAELPPVGRAWLAGKLGLSLNARLRSPVDQATWEKDAALRAERYLRSGNAAGALTALRERAPRLPGSALYRIEVDALRLQGDVAEALATAERGLQGATGKERIELLLTSANILEGQGRMPEALIAAGDANELLPRGDGDPILRLRVLITRIRLLRKQGDKPARNDLRSEALELIDQELLKALAKYPRLLEESAAELGKIDTEVLGAAVKQLGVHVKTQEQAESLTAAFSVLPESEAFESMALPDDMTTGPVHPSDAPAWARDLVERTQGAGLGKIAGELLKSGNRNVAPDLTAFFRSAVDKGLGSK